MDGGKRVHVSEEGQEAETVFHLVERREEARLLEAELLTGRTHQIRVHLAHLKHPVLGDDKYGDFDLNKALRKKGLKRMFLHAAKLGFDHPSTGSPVQLESPLPADLQDEGDDVLGRREGVVARSSRTVAQADQAFLAVSLTPNVEEAP